MPVCPVILVFLYSCMGGTFKTGLGQLSKLLVDVSTNPQLDQGICECGWVSRQWRYVCMDWVVGLGMFRDVS